MVDFKQEIINLVNSELKKELESSILEVPPDKKMGDFAFPCFILSKELKKSPVDIAKTLASKLKPNESISQIKAIGPYLLKSRLESDLLFSIVGGGVIECTLVGVWDGGGGEIVSVAEGKKILVVGVLTIAETTSVEVGDITVGAFEQAVKNDIIIKIEK